MLPKRALQQFALLCLSLVAIPCCGQPVQPRIPNSLEPGLYYYFHPGDSKPRIHYVPDPTNAHGDPFASAVKPLPVRGQENFPSLPLDTLQRWTYDDFLQYQAQQAQSRSQTPQPVPQPRPAYSSQQYTEGQPDEQPFYPQQQWQPQPGQQPFYPQQLPPARPSAQPLFPQLQPQADQRQFYRQPPAQAQTIPWSPEQRDPQSASFQGQAYQPPPTSPFQAQPPESGSSRERRHVRGVPIGQMQQALDMARKALALLDADRNEEACALLERAALLDPNPNSAPIHSSLGRAHRKLGNRDRAVKEYQTALNFEPRMESATLGIASCYQEMGKIPEAISWYQRYLDQNPRSVDPSKVRSMIAALKKAAESGPCDDPDGPDYLASVMSQGARRWPREKLPLKVFIDPGSSESGYRKPFKQMLIESFDTWCQAAENRVTWILESDPDKADINCRWARTTDSLEQSTGAEGGQTMTEMTIDHEGNRKIEKARITLLTLTLQGKPVPDGEMKSTALHEVGHVLGLGGHSSNPQDIMFFTVSGSTARALSSRDKATLCALYTEYPPTGN